MTCDKYKDILPLYALGEVDESQKQEIESHLESCPDCIGEVDKLSEIITGLNSSGDSELSEVERLRIENDTYKAILASRPVQNQKMGITNILLKTAAVITLIVIGFSVGKYLPGTTPTSLPVRPMLAGIQTNTSGYIQSSISGRFTSKGIRQLVKGTSNTARKTEQP